MTENKNIPKHWKVAELGEVCEKISLNGIKIKQKDYLSEGRFPVVDQGQDLIGGYFNDERLVIPNEPPYIIFGDHTKVKKYINFRFIAGADGVKVLKPHSIYDSKFFFYLIHTVNIPDKGYARHFQFLEKVEIPIPPLPEQLAIVSKIEELFSELDNGKQQLLAAQQQLKVYRQSLLKAAFEGKLTEEWRNRQKQKANEGLAVAAEPETKYGNNGGLPEGWEIKNLKSICKITGGVTKGKDYKGKQTVFLPYLRVANVQDGFLNLTVIKEIEVLPTDLEKYRLLHGDVLYTEGGDKDKLGRGTIWKNEIENCIHQNHIFRARPDSRFIASKFLSYFSQTKLAKDYFYSHGKQTTNLASINLTILSNLPVSIPPIDEQIIIVDELESKLTVCDKIEETIAQSLQQADTLRQSILKKAFEGKLV